MRLLEKHPEMSQRQLARDLGISLGKINYCLNALIDLGWIKVHNTKKGRNNSSCFYEITPQGLAAKVEIARRFLQQKTAEHKKLGEEIEQLRGEVGRWEPAE